MNAASTTDRRSVSGLEGIGIVGKEEFDVHESKATTLELETLL